jgi:uncharacterized membrane protein SpoIIM required for sporulation
VSTPGLSSRWLDRRQPFWDRLEILVTQGRHGTSGFTHDELRELALLYRQTAADLATVREHQDAAHLSVYLNRLLGSAHNLVYAAPRARAGTFAAFIIRTIPATFRRTWRYSAAAAALFAVGGLAGAVLTLADPGFARFVLGGEMIDTISRGEMWTHSILAVKPLASAGIMTNNLSVALAAFATGMTIIGPIYFMLFNGIMIGVVGVACQRAGLGLSLWSFVAPHGALELPAIFIAGGAGLLLASGLVLPGPLPRRESLTVAAGTATQLMLAAFPLLVIAGLIEGFISPGALPPVLKLVTGAGILTLLGMYLLSGRASPGESSPTDW